MWYLIVALVYFAAIIGVMVWMKKDMSLTLPFKIAFALALVAGWALPALAADMLPAHETAAPASAIGSALQTFLQQTILPVVSALVLGLVSLLSTRLGQKYKIQTLTEKNNFLFRLAAQGVALAEEHAAKLAGSVSKLTGRDKLDIAVSHLLAFAPTISREQAENIVHSMLAQIPGAGATGEAVTLLPQEGGYSIPAPGFDVIAGELAPMQPVPAL